MQWHGICAFLSPGLNELLDSPGSLEVERCKSPTSGRGNLFLPTFACGNWCPICCFIISMLNIEHGPCISNSNELQFDDL